jgi:hypothetical protein
MTLTARKFKLLLMKTYIIILTNTSSRRKTASINNLGGEQKQGELIKIYKRKQ